jgi:hypothetical protein
MKRIITILIAVFAFAACEKQTPEIRITKEILQAECPGCDLTYIEQREATAAMEAYLYVMSGERMPEAAAEVFHANKDAIVGEVVMANFMRQGVPYSLVAIYAKGEKKIHHIYRIVNK